MFESKGNLKLPILKREILVLVLGIGYTFYSGPILADEELLPSDHGYMLIHLNLSMRERVDLLALSSVDTDHVVRIREESFVAAGLNAWMTLVAMPTGRYYWSEYQPKFGMTRTESQRLPSRYRRTAPGSASETFEIVPGVINYVGDWTMRFESTRRAQLNPIVEFDKVTLERYVTEYPDYSNKYQIYISAMGKEAISLDELAKSTE